MDSKRNASCTGAAAKAVDVERAKVQVQADCGRGVCQHVVNTDVEAGCSANWVF